MWNTVIIVGAFIATAQCLTCTQCPIGVFGKCLFAKDVVCDNSTLNCYSGEAQFNATSAISLHNRGCLDSDLCGKTLTGSLLGAAFTSSFECCQTDLCNGAMSVQFFSLTTTTALCIIAMLLSV